MATREEEEAHEDDVEMPELMEGILGFKFELLEHFFL